MLKFRLLITLAATIVPFSRPATHAVNSYAGQVVFFAIGSYEDWQSRDALDDFQYYYQQIIPWLEKQGINHTMKNELPIIIAVKNKTKEFQQEDLDIDMELILVNGDGNMQILYGVLTDIDWQSEIKNFLKIQ